MKQMGDTSAQQMKQLVSVLAVQDPQVPTATTYPMSEPVAYVNSAQFPGHVAGHTQTAAVPQGAFRPIAGPPPAPPASNQGRAQVQCWNCGGDHYKSGCPLLPRPSRRTWDTGDLAQELNYYGDCTPAVSYGHLSNSYGRTGGYAAGPYYGNDGNHGMQGNSSWGGYEAVPTPAQGLCPRTVRPARLATSGNKCGSHRRWGQNSGHTRCDQHASGKLREGLLSPLPIRRPLGGSMSNSVSKCGHYHRTCTKAVQTEAPVGHCKCNKLVFKDVGVQCDLDRRCNGEARRVTFSPNIKSRCDIPDKSQRHERPVPLARASHDDNVNEGATQYGQGDEVPWNMSTQILSQLFKQEEGDGMLKGIRDDLQSPSRDNNGDISYVVDDLAHVAEVERDVTDSNVLVEPQIAEDYFDMDGLCVKGLRFNILRCIRQAVKRHSEKQCGSDCTGSDNCIEQYARELSL